MSAVFNDRRKSPRVAFSQLAKVQIRADAFPRDCRVSNISEGGVRLFVEGLDIPDEFVLLLDGIGRRDCRVVWRLGHELGAEFVEEKPLPRYAALAHMADAPAPSRAAQGAVSPRAAPPCWHRGMRDAPKTRPLLGRTALSDKVVICAWSHIQDCWLEQILTAHPHEPEALGLTAWAEIPPVDLNEAAPAR